MFYLLKYYFSYKIYTCFLFFIIVIPYKNSCAQQLPIVDMWYFSLNTVNPAVTAIDESIWLNTSYTNQWLSFKNSPKTFNTNFSMPVFYDMGIGISFLHDSYGLYNQDDIRFSYAYRLQLMRRKKYVRYKPMLAFGFSAGAYGFGFRFDKMILYENNDALAQNEQQKYWLPDASVGVYLFSEGKYGIGAVYDHLFGNKIPVKESYTRNDYTYLKRMLGLHGIFQVYVSDMMQLIPHVLFYKMPDAPAYMQFSGTILYDNKYWFGMQVFKSVDIAFNTGFILKDRYILGYSYKYSISQLSKYHYNTHEFVFRYQITDNLLSNLFY